VALFFTQLLEGIQSGAIYASLAIALVLVYKTTGILNFAQGEMALFSTYLVWKFTTWDLPVWIAIIAAMVVSFIGGALIERVVIRPVERSAPLVIVIVTIGLFLALNSLTQLAFGNETEQLASAYVQKTWRPGGVQISSNTLVLVAMLALECGLLFLLLQRTKLGVAFRGVASNPESSRLLGVPVGRILMVGWGLAAAVGCFAGALVIPTTAGLVPSSMQSILVFAFAAAALGGFDSVFGAVVGGMIVGVADAMTTGYVDALHGLNLLVPFGLILLVLLFRPAGLFGTTRVERV
jgi:branched-chain amino acid transport system permease protein